MSIFGSDPDNPVSGDMPADKLEGSDTVVGLSDQGDSMADSATDGGDMTDAASPSVGGDESPASEAVRDPSPAVAPADGSDDGSVNDIGGVGSTSATLPEDD